MVEVKVVSFGGHNYFCHPHHRNKNQRKSQWTISVDDEHGAFKLAVLRNWLAEDPGWSLHVVDAKAAKLGVSAKETGSERELFMAKLVGLDPWHGYPADPHRRAEDMPSDQILSSWMTEGYLRPQIVRKLLQGQPCNL